MVCASIWLPNCLVLNTEGETREMFDRSGVPPAGGAAYLN